MKKKTKTKTKTKTKKKNRNQKQEKENKEGVPEPIRSSYPLFILLFWVFFRVFFQVYYPMFLPLLCPLFLPILPPGMPPLLPHLFSYPRISRVKKRSKNGKKSSKKNRENRKKKPRSHISNCKNAAILSVNWTAGFLLSDVVKNKQTFNSAAFRTLLTFREVEYPNVPIAIHGLWLVLQRNGKNVRRPGLEEDDIVAAGNDLLKYLQRKPERIGYLDKYWPDLRHWSPISWGAEPWAMVQNWDVESLRFRIIVSEFLLHGRPMGLSLSEYIDRTIEEFHKIMIGEIIRNIIHFPESTGEEFSLGANWIQSADSMHLISDLQNSLGKRPSLSFMRYTSPLYGARCILCEFNFRFSLTCNGQEVEFILEDQPSDTKCNRHPGLPPNTLHGCVVLSHRDRWTRLQD